MTKKHTSTTTKSPAPRKRATSKAKAAAKRVTAKATSIAKAVAQKPATTSGYALSDKRVTEVVTKWKHGNYGFGGTPLALDIALLRCIREYRTTTKAKRLRIRDIAAHFGGTNPGYVPSTTSAYEPSNGARYRRLEAWGVIEPTTNEVAFSDTFDQFKLTKRGTTTAVS